MDIINNIAKLDYQAWKKGLNQFILYNYFKDEVEQKNKKILERINEYNKIEEKTEQQNEDYLKLVNQAIQNSSSIYKKVQENIDNQELLNEIYSKKNIDLSKTSYERWLKTGQKIKI